MAIANTQGPIRPNSETISHSLIAVEASACLLEAALRDPKTLDCGRLEVIISTLRNVADDLEGGAA